MVTEVHSSLLINQPQEIHRTHFALDTVRGDRIRAQVTYSDNFEGSPLLIAPGWSNGIESMGGLATLIAANVPVVTLDHSRSRSNYDPEERKKDSLRAAINHSLKWLGKPGDEFDMLAYSEGAINGLMLAEQEDNGRVQALTAHAPAGLAERSYWQVTSGAAGEILRLVHPRHHEHAVQLGKQAAVSALYVAANPLLALHESHIAATTRTSDRLGILAENIPVGISAGTYDGFFPAADVRAGAPKNVPFFEYSGNHTDILYRQSVQAEVWRFHQDHPNTPKPLAA